MSVPSTMRAMGFVEYGSAQVLREVSVPIPVLKARDVLVKIRAVAVNPIDTMLRANVHGAPPPTEPRIVGFDGAGVVVSLGAEASQFHVGDEVYFAGVFSLAGSYAEYIAIDERIIAKKPKSLSFEQAAAKPLTALTAAESLFEELQIPESKEVSSKSLLVINGAGGVGTMAIQLAKLLCKVKVIATASRAESKESCLSYGADHVINHLQPLKPQLSELGISGVDYIFDCAVTSSEKMAEQLDIINPMGKICFIAAAAEPIAVNTGLLVYKRVALLGEIMFARAMNSARPELQGQHLARLAELIDSAQIKPHPIKQCGSLWTGIQAAHEEQESRRVIGKLVLTLP